MKISNCYDPNSFRYGNFCGSCLEKYPPGDEVIVIEITEQAHDSSFWNAHLEKCELCKELIRVKTFTVPSSV